jgi:hypothetical protein
MSKSLDRAFIVRDRAAWHYRHHPFVGRKLRQRQRGAPTLVIDHAWRAQQLPALAQTHQAYLRAVDETGARLHAIELELRDLLTLEPLWSRV